MGDLLGFDYYRVLLSGIILDSVDAGTCPGTNDARL